VENGIRPPSPAVVNGYEQAIGVRLATDSASGGRATLSTNRLGEDANEMRRRAFTAAVAAIAAGGPLGEPVHAALATLTTADTPTRVGLADVMQVEQAEAMFTTWDLRFGGGLAREMASAQLKWATRLLDAQMTDDVRAKLHTAVGSLAERAAWSSFDAGQHESARTLFKLALFAATEADDADLRAHVLSDIATQHLYLGHPAECLKVIRLAEGDDRITPAVRFVLHGVKARSYGAAGDADHCAHQIGLAEQTYADVQPDDTPAWMNAFLTEAHVHSVTGQAAYSLARSRNEFSDDAHIRLTRAVAGFDSNRARAIALCSTRLAILHLHAGHVAEGTFAARTALRAAPGLRSERIARDLTRMQRATDHLDDDTVRKLRVEITDALSLAA
jgi:hypothetical protein